MELPDVLNKLTHHEGEEKEYFWAIEIWPTGVKSAIWSVRAEKTQVVTLGSREMWQGTVDDLVQATDRSLGKAVDKFPEEDEEPSKVIFGLPYDWLENDKIIASWQQMLQTLCEKLELSPLGFVLTIDALNHHLRQTEGMPPSAILVGPQKDQVLVAVLEQGKVKGVETVRRSENLAADVYEGLLRFEKVEPLPSRILLFNGEEMEEERQVLMDFSWEEKLPFLHLPKIEILPVDFDITSVCLAGGSEVAKSLGFKVSDTTQEVEAEEPRQEAEEESLKEEGEPEEQPDFGFIKGRDIRGEKPLEEEAVLVEEEKKEEEIEPPETLPELPFQPSKKSRFPSPATLLKKLPAFSFPALPRLSMIIILVLIIFFLFGGTAFAYFWFVPRAEVVLYVSPKVLEKEFEMIVDPNQEAIDEANFILPGKVVEAQASGEKTVSTTGKKTVGEKAQGEVTIYNTGPTRNLSAGTVLTGPGGLKFVLDRDVNIGSGSAVTREEVKTPLAAAEIGAEYNLAADSTFSIANLDKSMIGAKNETALSGGTSRQIQAVSEEDQKALLKSLNEELVEKAKVELLGNIPSGKKLIEESVTTKENSRSFDHKVGDEAADLKLSLGTLATALTFAEEEFLLLSTKQLAGAIPEGYEARKEGIQSRFEVKKQEKDGSVRFLVNLSAKLLPKINLEEIAQNIKGKYPSVASGYLEKLPGLSRSEIQIQPKLPDKLLTLPRRVERITFDLRSQ